MLCSILLAYITSAYVLLMVKAVALRKLLLEMVVLQGFVKGPVPVVIWGWVRLKDA